MELKTANSLIALQPIDQISPQKTNSQTTVSVIWLSGYEAIGYF